MVWRARGPVFFLYLMEEIGDISVFGGKYVFPLRTRGSSSFLMNRFALRSSRRGHYIPS